MYLTYLIVAVAASPVAEFPVDIAPAADRIPVWAAADTGTVVRPLDMPRERIEVAGTPPDRVGMAGRAAGLADIAGNPVVAGLVGTAGKAAVAD